MSRRTVLLPVVLTLGIAARLGAGSEAPGLEDLERCSSPLERCSGDEILDMLALVGGVGIYGLDLSATDADLRATIVRRVGLERLVEALRGTQDESLMAGIVEVLHETDDPEVAKVFAARHAEGVGAASYRMTVYLARRGDRGALRLLAENHWRWGVSSHERAYGVPVFGEQLYYAATPQLIESLDAASLNLSGAAAETLDVLYPGAGPEDVASPAAARRYFTGRWNERNEQP